MENKDKKYIKTRFALALNKIIKGNKDKAAKNKLDKIKDPKLVNSLRKLEASSGISFPIIQRISTGEKNPALTTIISIAEGLGISEVELFSYYSQVTDEDIKTEMEKRKKKKKK